MLSTVVSVMLWVAAAAWFGKSVLVVWDITAARRLPPWNQPPHEETSRRSVSVVVAARNEAARIEATVRRLLAQQAIDLEVIVVDDRSSDGTGEILDRLRQEDGRLTSIRVQELPDGWLGKCHACHRGAGVARGEWLLFCDGDIWLKPDVIARAVAAAGVENVDHVCLTPGLSRSTMFAKAGLLTFQMAMTDHVARVNRDRRRAFIGIGAFNLIRAETYRAFGGHDPLRMEVIDDMKLGLLVRRAGRRTRCYIGNEDVQADWAADTWGIVKALEKNLFAQLQFNLPAVVLLVLVITVLWTAAVVGPWTGTPAGIAAGIGLISMVVPAAILAAQQRWPLLAALLTPLACLILVVATINSTAVTLCRGGIRWRDTFYPLQSLRNGRVR